MRICGVVRLGIFFYDWVGRVVGAQRRHHHLVYVGVVEADA